MEDILKILENLSVKPNKVEIDELIENLPLGKPRGELEWENLQETLTKLVYLDDWFDDPQPDILVESLNRYLQYTDKTSIRYLKDIEWAEDDPLQNDIKTTFEESLNITEPLEKLTKMIEAYNKMSLYLEEYNMYFIPSEIQDQNFLNQFPKKRKNTN